MLTLMKKVTNDAELESAVSNLLRRGRVCTTPCKSFD